MNETEARADLLARGYVPISTSPDTELQARLAERGLVAGARVCNEGEKWFEARESGTGVLLEVFHKPESSWALTYGRPDVEVIVKRDKCKCGTCRVAVGVWQDYGTHVAYSHRPETI